MSFNNLKISDFIEQQLPSFIVEEFPKFVEFFQDYYKSLEIRGGVFDVATNILEYLDIESLTKSNLISQTTLEYSINNSAESIEVNSVVGLPEVNGIVLIDDEIIFYQEVNKTTNTLLNCKRGYSASTELKDLGTTVQDSVADSHVAGAVVKNLSDLFLFSILQNYEEQYLEGFPYAQLDERVDPVTLIENIKDFYSSKGTNLSIEFLFRSIFAEEVVVRFPRENLVKASTSDWTVDDIIKVEAISGDPYNLVGFEINQSDARNTLNVSAIVDSILVNNISSYSSGNKIVYEIKLNILQRSNFIVPATSFLRKNITASDTVITVDSTIGFPENNGIIQINNELIAYTKKTYNQFIGCIRGSDDTVASSHVTDSEVRTTEFLFGYKEGTEDPDNLIKMRLLGVISSTNIEEGSVFYSEDEAIDISPSGILESRKEFTEWLINETGSLASSSNGVLNSRIKDYTSNVASVYRDDNYAYVASNGLPSHAIGPFFDVPDTVGPQYLLKTIPLRKEKITQVQPIGTKGVGIFVNGVEAYSNKSYNSETFGEIVSVDIINNGQGFIDSVAPVFRLTGGGGSGATFTGTVQNNKVTSISVSSGGSNYTSQPTLEVAYGFDATAAITNDSHIQGGSIRTITVVSGGTNWVEPPDVVITDNTGRGKNAYAVATISGGTVVGIDVLNGGIDYNDKDNVVVTLRSKGTGVVTNVNVRKWNYDRVFTLNNFRNLTTNNWEPSLTRKVDGANGYLFDGLNSLYGLEYAYAFNPKQLRSQLSDNVQGVTFDYGEITSGFTHSPIIGWAYDGSPIYGPYGYTDSLDSSSGISRMASSYALLSSPASNRPDTTSYPMGSFVEDYEYINGLGDLDQHNGRFCHTPEYPEGVYAYFITIDSIGNGIFPYIVGNSYKYVPSTNNFIIDHIQIENNLSARSKRIRTNRTPNKGFDARAYVNSVNRGRVDSFEVYDSEPYFKVNDYLFVDSTDTEGSGIIAKIDGVQGVTVSSVTYSVTSGFTASGITITSGLTQFPFPTRITCPGVTIPYEAYIQTTEPHNLSNNDQVVVNFERNILLATVNYKVRVSSYQIVSYNDVNPVTFLDADVTYTSTTINVDNITNFANDDYVRINSEIMKIVSINYVLKQFTVLRAQLGTTLGLHAASNNVTLHVPSGESSYRFNEGDPITDGTATGTIYHIDLPNKTIEIRVSSGDFSASSTITDNSTPPKTLDITSVTTKQNYWEIDPSNTGNYFVRDLNFEMIRGSRYIFDVSDPSISGYILTFSEDRDNINEISTVSYSGVPGTSGATITVFETTFDDLNIAKIYYYELRNRVLNNLTSFDVKDNYFEGTHTITLIDNYNFKYPIQHQLEYQPFVNTTYTTTSQSAIGKIHTIKTIDSGSEFKKLPKVIGVTHQTIDEAEFTYTISGGEFLNTINVIQPGYRYSSQTEIVAVSNSGSGAVFSPTIIDGEIISVSVVNGGSGYDRNDKIVAIDKGAIVYPTSTSIGSIKSVRFGNFGNQFNKDRTLTKELNFKYNLIVTNTLNGPFRIGEILESSGGIRLQVLGYYEVGNKSYLLNGRLISGFVEENVTLSGNVSGVSCVVAKSSYPKIYANVSGYVQKSGYYDSDLGKVSSSSQKITDSYYYQDFSYVIRTTRSLNTYRKNVNRTLHPLGFKLFGEVGIESDETLTPSGATLDGSVRFPEDPLQLEVHIVMSGVTVLSALSQVSVSVSMAGGGGGGAGGFPFGGGGLGGSLNRVVGQGSALLNVNNSDFDALRMVDVSGTFNELNSLFALSSVEGRDIDGIRNENVIVLLNEIFQEPAEYIDISSVTYSGGLATITTNSPHNYAYTSGTTTNPVPQYITLSGIVHSGVTFNLNDTFEIYNVPSADSFVVLFDTDNTTPIGSFDSSALTNSVAVKGTFEIDSGSIRFFEPPGAGGIFYSILYNFTNNVDRDRYSFKVKNLLFDGIATEFELYKPDNTGILTVPDEDLLVFLDGVYQKYGEAYTIDRSVFPNKIIFSRPPRVEQDFFAYSFSKYKFFDNITSQIDGFQKSFNIQYNSENYNVNNPNQLLVLLDGVPQRNGDSYTITDSILNFKEAPAAEKICTLIYFYGGNFDKTLSIYNGAPFAPIVDIGGSTPDGCRTLTKDIFAVDYIQPGDLIAIEGESPKEIISINKTVIEYSSDLLEYVGIIFSDTSYIRGKNAVGQAVVSGPSNGIGSVNIVNPGMEYDTAPVIVFQNDCGNPGSGASAVPVVENGKIVDIVVTNPGSGYTSAPEVVFAKKYEIIRKKYPVYDDSQLSVVITSPNIGLSNTFNVISTVTSTPSGSPTYEIPIISDLSIPVQTIESESFVIMSPPTLSGFTPVLTDFVATQQIYGSTVSVSGFTNVYATINYEYKLDPLDLTFLTSYEFPILKSITNGIIDTPSGVTTRFYNDPLTPKLTSRIGDLELYKFTYEPLELNSNEIESDYTSFTIGALTNYMPNLKIEDVTNRAFSAYGSDPSDPAYNFGLPSYTTFGVILASDINELDNTIVVSGNTSSFPTTSGYISFGNETIQYTTISGQTLENCQRGMLGTTAAGHTAGDYIILAWQG